MKADELEKRWWKTFLPFSSSFSGKKNCRPRASILVNAEWRTWSDILLASSSERNWEAWSAHSNNIVLFSFFVLFHIFFSRLPLPLFSLHCRVFTFLLCAFVSVVLVVIRERVYRNVEGWLSDDKNFSRPVVCFRLCVNLVHAEAEPLSGGDANWAVKINLGSVDIKLVQHLLRQQNLLDCLSGGVLLMTRTRFAFTLMACHMEAILTEDA